MSGHNNGHHSNATSQEASQTGPRLEDWERYTKGVGSKLLLKMGFKPGQGLGKNNEGIVEPIKVQANKGRSMLGLETEEREHRRREKVARLSKHKGLRYESEEDSGSSEDDLQSKVTTFVQDTTSKQDSESTIDEDSPQFVARQLIASNDALIERLKEEHREAKAKRSMLGQTMAEYQRDLKLNEDLVINYRSILNLIQQIETIYRNDKLDLNNFWSYLTSTISPQTRNYMIQAFAVPLLKKTYNKLVIKFQPNQVDEKELENILFYDMIDVAREWLKTGVFYEELIEWYLEWSKLLVSRYESSKRIEYFRRKLLDAMYLATIKNKRDLNSFHYVAYNSDAGKQTHHQETDSCSHSQKSASNNDSRINLRQLIEQRASENGLTFMPVHGRTHESKQVYKLEKLNVYIDNYVIFVKKNDQWSPKTVDDLF